LVLAAVALVVLLHAYLYWRLVHSVTDSRRWRRLGLLVLVLLLASTLGAFGLRHTLPPTGTTVLNWVGYLWLALVLYLVLALVVVELPRAVLARTGSGGAGLSGDTGQPRDAGRRRTLARLLGAAAALVAAGTVGYGVREARSPRLVRKEITLDRLDPELDGVSIAALSDIHLGAINGRPFLADIVRQVNAAQPDLVAVVGDLIDGTVGELGTAAAALGDLVAPTYFVTGNHEYFYDAEQWCEFLPSLGVRVLRNERVAVGRHGAPGGPTFDLAGIDDRTAARSGEPGHGANLAKALDGRDPARPVVLLAHQPVMVDQAARRDVDLQISGHTHGGQFMPFGYLVLLDQPVLAGLTRVGRLALRDQGRRLLGSAGAGRRAARDHLDHPAQRSALTLRGRVFGKPLLDRDEVIGGVPGGQCDVAGVRPKHHRPCVQPDQRIGVGGQDRGVVAHRTHVAHIIVVAA
jgi:predicted MPP superfamily phosphohydrolase